MYQPHALAPHMISSASLHSKVFTNCGKGFTCVSGQGSGRDDRLVFIQLGSISHIVLECSFGFVVVVGHCRLVVLRVKAVV